MTYGIQPIVVENGTKSTKAGFAGDDFPSAIFPCVVGYPRFHFRKVFSHPPAKDIYVGDEAMAKRGMLTLKRLTKNGIIENWECLETVLDHTFNDMLHVSPEEHPILLTEMPLSPKAHREKLAEIMFENFKVPGMYPALQPILTLYFSGRTTGLVLDLGEESTYIVPIYEGYALPHAISRLNLGGELLTLRSGLVIVDGTYVEMTLEDARDIKEKFGYVALDFEQELLRARANPALGQEKYKLCCGDVITIGASKRFEGAEALFQPSLIRVEDVGIHNLTYQSIMKCDPNIRKCLYKNIVLSGGSTFFPGFEDRITKELLALSGLNLYGNFRERISKEITSRASTRKNIDVVALPKRKHSSWIGGSILASLSTFDKMVITKDEYAEYGPDIVYKKCF